MTESIPSLLELGWRPFFQQQLNLDELERFTVGRVVEQHRSGVIVMSELGQKSLIHSTSDNKSCVGDWVLFDESLRLMRPLERQSLFQRKAPGSKLDTQLIAANVDTVMIVCSLNYDFKLSRIERYLAIAKEAQVEPVIVLTKSDLCDSYDEKRQQVQSLDPLLLVYTMNALDATEVSALDSFCSNGKTIVFLGSSGVGKSTLVNSLLGFEALQTGSIREDDSKGRHTTTHRALKLLPSGGLLMDTPGMRELQLSDCEQGVSETFSELAELAKQCRFNDCTHGSEPGCAIQAAIKSGEVAARRLVSYQKLMREQMNNAASLADKRAKDKAFGKMVNRVQNESRHQKKGY